MYVVGFNVRLSMKQWKQLHNETYYKATKAQEGWRSRLSGGSHQKTGVLIPYDTKH